MRTTSEVLLNDKTFSFETGRFARQADGAVMVRYADTMVLAAVVSAPEPKDGMSYFPLQVEFREKISAAGKIPGGFFKREGRPTEKEILSARLIDRPIRPMFPSGYRNETQVVVTVYSSDMQHDGDVLGACAASAALMISNIPFEGPIAEVRVGRIEGKFIVNPTHAELDQSDMDVTLAGTEDSIVMVEGESLEISESEMLDALKFGHEAIRKLCKAQMELVAKLNPTKRSVAAPEIPEGLQEKVASMAAARFKELSHTVLSKEARSEATNKVYEEVQSALATEYPEKTALIDELLHDLEKVAMRSTILGQRKRLDGRGLKDIRPISCEVGLLPRTHGSSLFVRGETQSLTTVTLGTKMDEQILDGLIPETTKRFMLHYNFLPFSVGEVGRMGGTNRREIGHGNLAERSLKNLIPGEDEFPYTIRIVSDILESNGSSSMATVCAGSLALFDAGVALRKPVAGIAMGLVKEGETVAVLSDILGNEDHLGDMDFKVAGTKDGITAFQMDIKIKGISFDIFQEALSQAKEGRMHILGLMNEAMPLHRANLSPYAPRLYTIKIPVDMIGTLIGPGGKNIRQLVKDTGAEINVEDDGTVTIAAVEQMSADKAIAAVKRLSEMPEVGKVYQAVVKKIMDFGAFVEFLPGKEGLVHISQLDAQRVAKVEDVAKVGDTIEVKLIRIDEEGRMNLSRKAVLVGDEAAGVSQEQNRERRPPRPGGHPGGHGGHRRGGKGPHGKHEH